ncbi:Protein of unknown function, partial [Gryllus bimaculatus]
ASRGAASARRVAAAVVLQLRGVPAPDGAQLRQQHRHQHHRAAGRHRLPALPRAQPGRTHDLVGAPPRLAHPHLRDVHLHQRRALPGAARRGLRRLDAADQTRTS